MESDGQADSSLLADAIRTCRKRRSQVKLLDSTGAELSGIRTLISALALRSALRRRLGQDEPRVAVLLPPAVAAALTNLALALDGRVTVGLNYTLTAEILNECLARAGIRHVITSRRFLERVPLALTAEFIFLEDVRASVSKKDKLTAAALANAVPSGLLLRMLGRRNVSNEEPMMIVFTSGTTAEPKGATLTYGNVAASLDAVAKTIRLTERDVVIGVLPFFHGFGSILTLWTALTLDVAAAYHPNPLDARGVGELCRARNGTILPVTPTFLRAYVRRGKAEDFSGLDVIVSGGERLTPDLADAVEAAFGIRPVEGYGATEASSLVSANLPGHRMAAEGAICREGTVGRPLAGIRAKAVDIDTGAELEPGRQGLLWIHGRNVMAGYFDQPEATRAVLRDGWYITGNVAVIHDDGCIEIVGRQSRFAKIGGEMVPLGRIEEELIACLGDVDDETAILAAVAIADDARGERIVVIHRTLSLTPSELRRRLIVDGIPPVFAPAAGDFVHIEKLPLTATGKIDFGCLSEIAAVAVKARRIGAPRNNAGGQREGV